MNKLRIYTILLALTTTVAWFSVAAQTTDSSAAMTTTTTSSTQEITSQTMNDSGTKQDMTYTWIGIGAFVVIAAGAGIYFVRRNKKEDGRPQTGSDINNPASGI